LPSGRSLRADAARNRGRILSAARALFADQGPDAQMDAIAARAGVAVGTLYRHFPTKEALLEAALRDRIEELTDLARAALERAAAGADPWEELAGLLRLQVAAHAQDRAFKAAAAAGGVQAEYEGGAGGQLVAVVEELIARAQAAGRLRDDVTATDLWLLLSGIPGAEVPAEVRERHLDIVLTGLRGRR
jgi:AcrR family transcriptional regulator